AMKSVAGWRCDLVALASRGQIRQRIAPHRGGRLLLVGLFAGFALAFIAGAENVGAANCRENARCPRPVIVAAAGGASRAAFFAATVLGYQLDAKQLTFHLDHSAGADQLSKKLHSRLSSIRCIIQTRGYSCARTPRPSCRLGRAQLCRTAFTRRRSS